MTLILQDAYRAIAAGIGNQPPTDWFTEMVHP